MDKHVQNQEEEIDLGGFFNQIGKLFSKLIQGFVSFFKGLFDAFIICLVFVKKHFWKVTFAIIVGLIIGILVQKSTPKTYYYSMVVEPKLEGTYYLENRVQYYNQLIDNNDYKILMNIFKIDLEDAKSLVKFKMNSIENIKDLVEGYDEFIKDKDTSTIKELPLKTYLSKKFSTYNYKKYEFKMLLNKSHLKIDIESALLKDIENNVVLQKKKADILNRLDDNENGLIYLMKNIDTIISKDKEIALTAAKNGSTSSNNLNVTSEKSNNSDKDVQLIQLYKNTIFDISSIKKQKEEYSNIYNVISPFKPLGRYNAGFFNSKIFQITILAIIIMIGIILFKPFMKYLDHYKK